jgi:Phospholipase_D-nuclease N-terminal
MAGGRNRRWQDLSARQRGAIAGAGIVQLALLAVALLDLRRRPADRINGDKRLWTAAVFVNWIGPLAYLAFGRKRS